MGVLNEDMIMEIVVRLPFKYAIQCSVLSKAFCRLISERKKALLSLSCGDIESSIFCWYDPTRFKILKKKTPEISSITHAYSVLDSCNGVLLLSFSRQCSLCVFNPISGGIMPVTAPIELRHKTVALAVDLDAPSQFQFKLVVAETLSVSEIDCVWRFSVVVPTGGSSWLIKSPVELIRRGPRHRYCSEFVYVTGRLYWPDRRNRSIIVFDVEKGKTGVIEWPHCERATLLGDGALRSVDFVEDKARIHWYDETVDMWKLKHVIACARILVGPVILFCNNESLLMQQRMPDYGGVFMHSTDKREKITAQDFKMEYEWSKSFFSFVPSRAKVSHTYLDHDSTFVELRTENLNMLRGLQRLMRQESRRIQDDSSMELL